MPPKGSGAAAVAAASLNWKVEVGGTQVKFTTFSPIGLLNGKNVSSSFAKADSQSYYSTRSSDEHYVKERESKRRRLIASQEELQQAGFAGVNVLKSAPQGSVRPKKAIKPLDPELEFDPLARTIIIHPGSSLLRIGRASDAYPVTVPNIIARKPRAGHVLIKPHRPSLVPNFEAISSGSTARKAVIDDDEDEDELDQLDDEQPNRTGKTAGEEELDPLSAKISSLRTSLKQRMRTYKLRGQKDGNQQANEYNATVVPERLEDFNDPDEIEWTETAGQDVFVGEKALKIADPDAAGFVLRTPYDRGGFNTNGYSSSQELLHDVETIWLSTLETELEIAQSELKDYSCILIIPDLYDQLYVREMTDLVLNSIGFKQVILQQESICATFGAGISTACVVDIGARVTSITCVEEGLVAPESRMVLDFGGDDVTAFLYTLLVRLSFPYKDADLSRWYDWQMMEQLKEKMVVLGEGDVGLNLYSFHARAPDKPTRKYSLRSYDDSILAPYALFAPRVIDFESKALPRKDLWSKDVDDNVEIGSETVTLAMKNSTRHLRQPIANTLSAPQAEGVESALGSPAGAVGTPTEIDSKVGSPAPQPDAKAVSAIKGKEPAIDIRKESSKIPLDVAIVESILATGAEERIRRLSNNVIITGGTAGIHNIGFAIESRIAPPLISKYPSLSGMVVVVPPPEEVDVKHMAWKGISSLAKLDCSHEMWVRKDEWNKLGMKVVRERLFYFA